MSESRVVYLCPSFGPYWVQIFDAIGDRIGSHFTVVTQSIQSATNARVAQSMGRFERRVIRGGRLPISDRTSEHGAGTPFGLNIAPTLPIALMQLNPQVVIANNFGLWTLASIGMGYRTVIFWEGTHHTERTVQRWRLRLRRWMASRAAAFVVNGSAAKAYIHQSLAIPEERIFEGGLCCAKPPENLMQLRRQPRANSVTRYVCVSRLIKGKGVDHLLKAAAMLRKCDGPARRFRLTIVGDGPERAALTDLSHELGLDGVVFFEGAVPADAIWPHYAKADVMVLPTLQDNWPLVVLEAMTMGLPVLLSRYAGSHQDLILEGRNGHTFEPEDHSALADLMASYSHRPEKIAEHGDESRKIVRIYDTDRAAGAFIQALALAGRCDS